MKRTLSCLLALVMLLSLSVAAAAETEQEDIELVSALDAKGEDATELVTVTSFADREELSEDNLKMYEDAIATILKAFEEAARNDPRVHVDSDEVVVALYDTCFVELDENGEQPFEIEVTAPENYKASMLFTDGVWNVIDTELDNGNVRYTQEGNAVLAEIVIYASGKGGDEEHEPGDQGFHPSRENYEQPELQEVVDRNGKNVNDNLRVIIYRDNEELPKVHRDVFELAYEDLYEHFDEISVEDKELSEAADGKPVAVSDAFFVSARDSSRIEYNLRIRLELTKYGTPDDDEFVALMEYVDGVWQFADSSVSDGVLSATIDHIGPFAIVVFSVE